MTIEHKAVTDPNIHEPKGVSSASNNTLYVANGTGSGSWQKITTNQLSSLGATAGQIATADGAGGVMYMSMPHGRIHFVNIATPYSLTYPSAYTKLAPTTTGSGSPTYFSEGTNARLTYNGTMQQHFHIAATISASQSAGANRDLRFQIYKNGVAVVGSEVIETSISGNKVSTAIHADVIMSNGDYLEVYAKNDGASGDVLIHTYYLFAMGMHEA